MVWLFFGILMTLGSFIVNERNSRLVALGLGLILIVAGIFFLTEP